MSRLDVWHELQYVYACCIPVPGMCLTSAYDQTKQVWCPGMYTPLTFSCSTGSPPYDTIYNPGYHLIYPPVRLPCCVVYMMRQQAPIHNSAPSFEEQGKSQEILVTGIKVRRLSRCRCAFFFSLTSFRRRFQRLCKS